MTPHPPLLVRWLCLGLLFVVTACDTNSKAGNSLFHQSRDLVKQGDFVKAKQGFEDYLDKHPQGQHASRASFFIAKCELGVADLAAARKAFEQCQKDYAGTDEASKSAYKLAFIDLLEGDEAAALKALKAMVADGNSTLAPEAAALAGYLESKAQAR